MGTVVSYDMNDQLDMEKIKLEECSASLENLIWQDLKIQFSKLR